MTAGLHCTLNPWTSFTPLFLSKPLAELRNCHQTSVFWLMHASQYTPGNFAHLLIAVLLHGGMGQQTCCA